MGQLALAGALGGLGKGLVSEVEHRRDVDKQNMQEQKEVRLRQMEIDYQKSAEAQRQDFQSKQQDKLFAQQSELSDKTTARQEALADKTTARQDDLEKKKLDVTQSEGALERASRERVAGIRAKATMASKKFQSRWQFVSVPGSQQIVDGQIVNKPASLILADKKSGQAWNQLGDKFVMQGGAVRKPKDPKQESAAVAELFKNPDLADQFAEAYGYLPSRFINQMQSQIPSSVSGPSGDQEEE